MFSQSLEIKVSVTVTLYLHHKQQILMSHTLCLWCRPLLCRQPFLESVPINGLAQWKGLFKCG